MIAKALTPQQRWNRKKLAEDPDYFRRKAKDRHTANPIVNKESCQRFYKNKKAFDPDYFKAKYRKRYKANASEICAKAREYREKNKDKVRVWDRKKELRKRGFTIELYEQMYASQGGLCAICGNGMTHGQRLCADHCHKTGKARGLLCRYCNGMLGVHRDNPEIFERAAQYLRGEA